MNHIGSIIREYRNRLGLRQKDLADDLCSEKYIYLIEKGERTPSAGLLRQFSDRLGVELFDICQYLDCYDPIGVYESVLLFDKYRRISDFDSLKAITEERMSDPDFQKAPWKCEIQINRFMDAILVAGKIEETVSELESMIKHKTKHDCLDKHVAQIYALLSIGYQMLGNLEGSQRSIEASFELMKNKDGIQQYKQVVITTRLTLLFQWVHAGRYEELLREADRLLEYQIENNLHDRIHYTFFLLALAHHNAKNMDMADKYCRDVIYTTLIYKKPFDVKVFMDNRSFVELIGCGRIDRKMVEEFYIEYQIDRK